MTRIARNPRFPNGTNVQLLRVVNRGEIEIEIWERGACYTPASGTSSCAAASAAHALGLVNEVIKVTMPGGVIEIGIAADGAVTMTAPQNRWQPDCSRQCLGPDSACPTCRPDGGCPSARSTRCGAWGQHEDPF